MGYLRNGCYVMLIDELQNRPFVAAHGSAFLGLRRTTFASTRSLLMNLKTYLIIKISKG
jgi:hypothetical protein